MRFIFILFLVFMFGCKNKANKEQIAVEYIEEVNADTLANREFIAVFDRQSEKKASLNNEELKIIDQNLRKAVNQYNAEMSSEKSQLINLRYYYRQYFVFEEDGDKKVYIFCFCSYPQNSDWQNFKLNVKDGGDCYLNVIINISKNKTEDFYANGLS